MKAIYLLVPGLCFFLLTSVHSGEKKDIKSLLVGTWEVAKSDEAPKGSTVEFTKDGRLILIMKGKDKKIVADYKVDGKKITTTRKEEGKVEMNHMTVQTINENMLTILNDKGKTDELTKARSK